MSTANPIRFKQLVHYVCSKCADDPTKLGAVKLNKALWLSDLNAYYHLGEPITSSRYVRRQFGPVPGRIMPVLRELETEGKLEVRTAEFYGKEKKEFIVLSRADANFLTEEQKQIVDRMIEIVTEKHTATSISNLSHDHIWHAAADGEEIPHYTVFANPTSAAILTANGLSSNSKGNCSSAVCSPMLTIIEEQEVSNVIDSECAVYPRLEDAYDALKWWLCRRPESGELLDDINWIYKQRGDKRAKIPALVVIYTFNSYYVTLKYILVRIPPVE